MPPRSAEPAPTDIVEFPDAQALWTWLRDHHDSHPGVWVRIAKSTSTHRSVTFHDLLEAGLAFGWSESHRRAFDEASYLQRFTPRRTRGTTSARNLRIAARLDAEGRLTPHGRRALGLDRGSA